MRRENLETVRLSDIGSDERFRITTRTDNDMLCESVRYTGLICPPILLQTDKEFVTVCGFRRIDVCRCLDVSDIPAMVLPIGTSDFECVTLAITDNALQRTLNLIEISRSLNLLSSLSDNEKDLSRAASSLGLPSNLSLIRKIKPLCLLPISVQEGILSESVALPIAQELQDMTADEAIAVATMFRQLSPSLNKQREILILIKEIALRENISLSTLIGELENMINDQDADKNQKIQKIRLCLKQRRYPALSRAEADFELMVKKLELGHGIDLIAPKYFEGREYTVALRFKTLGELKQHASRLDRMMLDPEFMGAFPASAR
jgi:hypothetical protein